MFVNYQFNLINTTTPSFYLIHLPVCRDVFLRLSCLPRLQTCSKGVSFPIVPGYHFSWSHLCVSYASH